MRFLLVSFVRFIQYVVEVFCWMLMIGLLLRLLGALSPSASINSWALVELLRQFLDPILSHIASLVGISWPAASGPAGYLPLGLAAIVWILKVFLNREFDRLRFHLWDSAEPARKPREDSAAAPINDSKSQKELLQAYRDIEKKLHAVRRKSCAFLNMDVVGSTKMKTGESLTNIGASFQAYEELLRQIFQQQQAWKQAWTPDGVLICFLDPALAVKAAQQVLRSLPQFNASENRIRSPFRVRCGISAGEVAIFDDTKLATFSDPLIDTAAHLQKDARPNSICVGEELCGKLADHAEFRSTGREVDGLRVYEWSLERTATDSTPTPTPTPTPATPMSLPRLSRQTAAPPAAMERTLAVTPNATRATRSIGRYEILGELGRGAMGAVYKAMDPQIGRLVAVKVIVPRGLDPEEMRSAKERFYREARAAGKLTHAGIVAIYDVAEDSHGSPYLVMEFVEGTSLDQALGAGGSAHAFTFAQRLTLAIEIAAALDYAHRQGVIHRDIKPANILLTRDGHPHPKIADFGIAKLAGAQASVAGVVLGTPAFVSPEQLTGSPADARSDIFSLGVVLYWMFTGQRPFTGDTMTAISYGVVHTMPRPVREFNWALPEELDRILFRCIAKNPAERYQSARELGADLLALRDAGPAANANR